MAACGTEADGERNGHVDGELDPPAPMTDEVKASCAEVVALLDLMEKTGYSMVQENGQRKYGGPPPDWEGPPPPRGCEVFVGKIPRDMYEDELVPLFERAGKLYEFRLMMEFTGENRGYAFVMYTNKEAAQRAIQMLDNYKVRPGKFIGVCVSLDNCRLFLGSIPKEKTKDEVLAEMKKLTDGVVDVIMYPSSTDKSKNRGFAFVEYKSHKAAAMARRKLIPGTSLSSDSVRGSIVFCPSALGFFFFTSMCVSSGRGCTTGTFQLWGQSIQVDWAQPEKDVEEEVMQRVRVLYVRNLMLNTSEETLFKAFSHFKPGSVERVKKFTDYAFVHYYCREDALAALDPMNGVLIDGAAVEVMLAKPAISKEDSSGSRRHGSRGYLKSNNTADQALDNKDLNEGGPTHTNYCLVLPGDRDGHFFPLFPGTPLSHTSVLALKPSQFSTAVSLLDVYCRQNNWLEPEYHLYSTPGLDTTLLLLYKVHNYLQLYTIVTLELQYSQGLMWLCVCAWCVFSGGDLINTQHLHARTSPRCLPCPHSPLLTKLKASSAHSCPFTDGEGQLLTSLLSIFPSQRWFHPRRLRSAGCIC
ncbi:unnamed protein product [Tetraodon nigroviridis]|uniref:Probable RNA-binding protein 46 n=1 Tax=Tetraodon nigroviridis TaxID=99883 RepID=Q4SKS9_TETNG|nr:unnamed protein product [Tetraodon nigroviridis]